MTKMHRETRKQELLITSHGNQWLKRFRSSLAGGNDEDGLVGVEGVRLVEAALGSGLPVEALLVSESGKRHLARMEGLLTLGLRILRTTDRLFAAIADTQAPQGVAVLVRSKTVAVDEMLRGFTLIVVLVGVQDPGNVGTILRAAEAFGATGAAACAAGNVGTANPLAPKALRASAGSALRLPILRGVSSTSLMTQLRTAGVKLYAAVPDSHAPQGRHAAGNQRTVRPWEADWKSPVALLIGNEGAGLPDAIVQDADVRISIPQTPPTRPAGIESLNAAMAGTILLYEARRQRDARA